ncbi:MAG: TetR/AcrR family transcriptional regulator [Bacilli bacterium]|nr:TetR/AcrR family transcriptional regulator [Bacilli bacterium]
MARNISFLKEDILEKSVNFIKEYGYSKLTVRELAKYIGCSTQPLFRNFENFDVYKKELKRYLRKDYESFIAKYVDKEDYLYTISYAYALYATEEPNIFYAMFMADLAGSRTVQEVLDTERNKETIIAMTNQYNISLDKANEVYRDVRFYTHGMATQLCVNSIKLSENEIRDLIKNNIEINLRRY